MSPYAMLVLALSAQYLLIMLVVNHSRMLVHLHVSLNHCVLHGIAVVLGHDREHVARAGTYSEVHQRCLLWTVLQLFKPKH